MTETLEPIPIFPAMEVDIRGVYTIVFYFRQVYLGLPKDHPWCNHHNVESLSHHQMLTWSKNKLPAFPISIASDTACWWVGWDYSHHASTQDMVLGLNYGKRMDTNNQGEVKRDAELVLEEAKRAEKAKTEKVEAERKAPKSEVEQMLDICDRTLGDQLQAKKKQLQKQPWVEQMRHQEEVKSAQLAVLDSPGNCVQDVGLLYLAQISPPAVRDIIGARESENRHRADQEHHRAEHKAAAAGDRPPVAPTLTFQRALIAARMQKGWGQEKLAHQIPVKVNLLKLWELGKATPKGAQIAKLNQVLSCVLPKP